MNQRISARELPDGAPSSCHKAATSLVDLETRAVISACSPDEIGATGMPPGQELARSYLVLASCSVSSLEAAR